MQLDDFLGLVKKRRNIRRFRPDSIPSESIERILEVARWAMSGANAQPWEFIVVRDQETKKKIGELYAGYHRKIATMESTRHEEFKHPGSASLPTGKTEQEIDDIYIKRFVNPPVLIVVCGDPRTLLGTVIIAYLYGGEMGPNATYLKNMANATQLIQLAAAAAGLASQWVSIDRSWESKLRALLDIPDELEAHTIVPIGYPDYEPAAPYRRELSEMVHYEKYDPSKFRTDDDIIQYLRKLRQMTRMAYKRPLD
jgi:nitroreductase